MSSFLLYTVFLGFHAGQLSTTCAARRPRRPPRPRPPAAPAYAQLLLRSMAPPRPHDALGACRAGYLPELLAPQLPAFQPPCLPATMRHPPSPPPQPSAPALSPSPRPHPRPQPSAPALGLTLGPSPRPQPSASPSAPALGRRYAELQRAVGASERLLGLLHRTPALPLSGGMTLPRSSWRGAVELEGVTFAYPANPDVAVLREASLSISAGQHVAIVGQSGCGKSTIAALLCALYAPGAGRTTLDGHDVLALDAAHLRGELVACVPQEPPLLAGTLRDNVAIGRPGATEQELRAAAAAAGCDFAAADWEREVTTMRPSRLA
jgi:hypothetical protein